MERFHEESIEIAGIIGVGGIARKSAFVMQMMADVLNVPIKVNRSEQVCAAGAAMLAACVAGVYQDLPQAMKSMGTGFDKTYYPDERRVGILNQRYEKYKTVCDVTEHGL